MKKNKKPERKEERKSNSEYLQTMGYTVCASCGGMLVPVLGSVCGYHSIVFHQCRDCMRVYEEEEILLPYV